MPLLSKSGLRTALGVGPKTLDLWMTADPRFPSPADRDAHGRDQWDAADVASYRETVVDEAEVLEILGKSRATLYARRRNDPDFPAPLFPNPFHVPPIWRRTAIEAYAKDATLPPLKAPAGGAAKIVTFPQFADLMGIKVPALHHQKQTDLSFPPSLTEGRGAVWARVDAEKYREYRRTKAPLKPWARHKDPDLDLVTMDEFAAILGLKPATVKTYKALREPGFPPPAADSRYPVWRRVDAVKFAKTRQPRES